MVQLFLSHSSADDGFVRELRQALADLGQEVWIDSRQLKGGDPLWSDITAAIEAAAGLAVLVSPASLQSRWVGKEVQYGIQIQGQRGRDPFPVIPLSLNGTRLGVLEDFFGEEPTYISVSSAPAAPRPPSTRSWWPSACVCPPTGRRCSSRGRSRWRSWCSNSATSASMSRTACAAPPPAPGWFTSPPTPASRRW
ncbi:MAG: toll/interleukin-1 receptor domain-containing protein [Cyanobacteria bacterium]|nr:toll/interleukin-1 receptor domain-containing protein [Cyanobacteriota bacterium]